MFGNGSISHSWTVAILNLMTDLFSGTLSSSVRQCKTLNAMANTTRRMRPLTTLPATSIDLSFGVSALQWLSLSVEHGCSTMQQTTSRGSYSGDGPEIRKDLRYIQDKSKKRNSRKREITLVCNVGSWLRCFLGTADRLRSLFRRHSSPGIRVISGTCANQVGNGKLFVLGLKKNTVIEVRSLISVRPPVQG